MAHLEIELESKLDDSSTGSCRYSSKRDRLASNIRRSEVGVIERVKQFGSELNGAVFADRHVLGDRKVKVGIPGSPHYPYSLASKCLLRRSGNRERVRIEPSIHSSLRSRQLWIPNQIWAGNSIGTQIENRWSAKGCRQWKTCLEYIDTGQLPVPQNQILRASPGPSPQSCSSPWHCEDVTPGQ